MAKVNDTFTDSADKVPDEMAPDRDIASQAARVTRARVAAGFKTMAAAARALGWPYPTYASYENGTISVRSRAEDLANLFGVEVQWLIDGTGPMFKGGKDPILEMFHELSGGKRRAIPPSARVHHRPSPVIKP